jgi:hypothetical protein
VGKDSGLENAWVEVRGIIHPMLANHDIVVHVGSKIVLEIMGMQNPFIVIAEQLSNLSLEG